jgi:hypothetical protein
MLSSLFSPSHSATSSPGRPRPPLSAATTSAAGNAASPSDATTPPAKDAGAAATWQRASPAILQQAGLSARRPR